MPIRKYTNIMTARYGKELLEYVNSNEDIVYSGKYFADKGIIQQTASSWLKDKEYHKTYIGYYHLVREILLARLLNGAITRKYDQTFTQYLLNCLYKDYGFTNKQEISTNYEGFTPPKSDPVQASEEKRTAFLNRKVG